jgi:alkanesulfonate monooxygenase SsuD/methylene tetrahydromethanopterin reductase-like flavin-dependent oxidoreductase (luciferase family)
LRSEAAALGSDFAKRNDLLDESIRVWKELWTGEAATIGGEQFRAHGTRQRPRPVQHPHPPIWVGGNSARARQRVAEYGQGWTPILANDVLARTTRTAPLPDLPALTGAIQDLHRRLEGAQRDPATVTVQIQQLRGPVRSFEVEGNYDPYLEWLADLSQAGVSQVLVHIPSDSAGRALEALERYAEAVIRQAP